MNVFRAIAFGSIAVALATGALSAQCMSCTYRQAAQAYRDAAAKVPSDEPNRRQCYLDMAAYEDSVAAQYQTGNTRAQLPDPTNGSTCQAGNREAQNAGQSGGAVPGAATGNGTQSAATAGGLNIPGLTATSAVLGALSSGSAVSQGLANSMLGGGLLVDGLLAVFGTSHHGTNADGRMPFNAAQFATQSEKANGLIDQLDGMIETKRLQLTHVPKQSNSYRPPAPDDAVTLASQTLGALPVDNNWDRAHPNASDDAIDVFTAAISSDVTRQTTGKGPIVLSIATSSDEMVVAAQHCSQGTFLKQAERTPLNDDASRAAVFEEEAIALDVCARATDNDTHFLFESWEAMRLGDAAYYTRKVGAVEAFQRNRARLLAAVPSMANDHDLSARYRRVALTAWFDFCALQSPEGGSFFPDYGRAEPWPQWHADCDALENQL